MAVAGFATLAGARPQDATKPLAIAAAKDALDEIEQALARDDITADALAALRQKLNDTAGGLRATIDDIEPRANEAEERLKQLGPPPAKDAAPETAEIAAERAELTARFGELDGALKEARVLSVRSDLNCAIIKRFREAAIEIPYPQRDLRWRGEKPHDGGDGAPPAASKRSS
jgi:small-conductance mechanosensitive channel